MLITNRSSVLHRARQERLQRYAANGLNVRQITCSECTELLPIFVLRELQGTDPGTQYPEVEIHLLANRGCRSCLHRYSRLVDHGETLLHLVAHLDDSMS